MHCAICVLCETLVVRNHANRGAALMQFAEKILRSELDDITGIAYTRDRD